MTGGSRGAKAWKDDGACCSFFSCAFPLVVLFFEKGNVACIFSYKSPIKSIQDPFSFGEILDFLPRILLQPVLCACCVSGLAVRGYLGGVRKPTHDDGTR